MNEPAARGAGIPESWRRLRADITAALAAAGDPDRDVTVVAVSKTFPPEAIRAAWAAGVREFGENKVQEARGKQAALEDLDVRWHMVGHLQTNKVKYVVDRYDLLHSLDRMTLAYEIDKRARRARSPLDCLVQVNASGEASKWGIPPDELLPFLQRAAGLAGLRIIGLMAIAPLVDDPEQARPVFRSLRRLADEIRAQGLEAVEMKHLSMGMTHDYRVALEEGATILRVGRALFGPREA